MRIIVSALVLLASARGVRADDAESLKKQGFKAAEARNWELARQKFEQSYALDARPLTLFNLAAAQEHTEKLLAARTSYTTFLDKTPPGENGKFRTIAKDALVTLERVIPTVRITVIGFAAGTTVELDGKVARVSEQIAVDPGAHTIVVRSDRELARRQITLARSAREEVELRAPLPKVVEPPPSVVVTPPPPPHKPAPHGRSIFASGWFWGITSAVVLGAAGGAGYYFLYYSQSDPTHGTLGRGVLQL